MNEHFEEILATWINGIKKEVYQEFLDMSLSEKEDFIQYLRTPELSRSISDHDRIAILSYLLIREM